MTWRSLTWAGALSEGKDTGEERREGREKSGDLMHYKLAKYVLTPFPLECLCLQQTGNQGASLFLCIGIACWGGLTG